MKRYFILMALCFSLCLMINAAKQAKRCSKPVYLTVLAENGNVRQRNNRDGTVTFIIMPNDVIRVSTILLNGKDVTTDLEGNKYTTPGLTKNATISICFDSTSTFTPMNYYTIASSN